MQGDLTVQAKLTSLPETKRKLIRNQDRPT